MKRAIMMGMALVFVLSGVAPAAKPTTRPPNSTERQTTRSSSSRSSAPQRDKGPALAPEKFLAQLQDKDPSVRAKAAERIGGWFPKPYDSTPDLIKALGDSDADVRRSVLTALAWMYQSGDAARLPKEKEPMRKAAIEALAKLIDDSDLSVRRQAMTTLGEIGLPAIDYSQRMIQILADPKDEHVHNQAAFALKRINPAGGHILCTMMPMARSVITQRAIIFGVDTSHATKEEQDLVVSFLKSPDRHLSGAAWMVVGNMKPTDAWLLDYIEQMCSNNDPGTRAQAISTAAQMLPREKVEAIIAKNEGDPSRGVQNSVKYAKRVLAKHDKAATRPATDH
jgi:hypothetical protein